MEWGPEAWVATYAAIVATGALSLEIRRWFESGPKIYVRATANMIMLDGRGGQTKGLLIVYVTNRGDTPTTITNLCLLDYPNVLARWRDKASRSFVIPHPQPPGTPPTIPHVLNPGQQWAGMAHDRSDVTGDVQTGTMYAAVYTTDRNRPYVVRIPKRKELEGLKDAKEI
ncbi:hypothetical protein [Neorhizobium galegae]|uniref:hypothetical protein n=1 Tax=Neorhizobium galegae TaxID=399 RepID=UPI000620F8C0|nr:hypothetical protein [Neorhizobium galegae]KAB1125901.1 hypothetical protein F4V90_01880 [Neorhizobium galegae]MCQ1806177.1 hypothetical protein [Neorhizobium galegae]CDZ55513.1 Hypothetical protein NGAL_HAMBI2566_01480 [Neorhizobium galegae bv. orientalis]